LTNAVLLPVVLRYNRDALGEKAALMCKAMGLPGEDFETFYQAIVALLDELEIPRDLAALGVSEELAPEIALKAYDDAVRPTNPVPSTPAEIEALIREAISKAR
jgi:alcohol dehydrogenase